MQRSKTAEPCSLSCPHEQREQIKLLFGPYNPPALQKGDRDYCLFRDTDVVVTSWSGARIAWPLCRALGSSRGKARPPGLR
jgi:hypothetical protein